MNSTATAADREEFWVEREAKARQAGLDLHATDRALDAKAQAKRERSKPFKRDQTKQKVIEEVRNQSGAPNAIEQANIDKFFKPSPKCKPKPVELTPEDAVQLELHRAAAETAAETRSNCAGPIAVKEAGPQVTSALAGTALKQHLQTILAPTFMDIRTKDWQQASSVVQAELEGKRLSTSFDGLVAPLLEHASRAAGRVTTDIVGVSEVGKLPLYRFCCHSIKPEKYRVLLVGGLHPREWHVSRCTHNLSVVQMLLCRRYIQCIQCYARCLMHLKVVAPKLVSMFCR